MHHDYGVMALPRHSAGGHHILLWIGAVIGAMVAAALLFLIVRALFQSWFP